MDRRDELPDSAKTYFPKEKELSPKEYGIKKLNKRK